MVAMVTMLSGPRMIEGTWKQQWTLNLGVSDIQQVVSEHTLLTPSCWAVFSLSGKWGKVQGQGSLPDCPKNHSLGWGDGSEDNMLAAPALGATF